MNFYISNEISASLSLGIPSEQIGNMAKTIVDDVLPKPSHKFFFLRLFYFFLRFQFGSVFLLLVQFFKKEFYMERHLDSDVILSFSQNKILLQELKKYLGEDFFLWRSEIWANYPSRQLIPLWHQDSYPKILSGTGQRINAYIALTEVNERNGFEYIPDSALDNNYSIKMVDPFSGNRFFELTEELQRKAKSVILQPGEFILFSEELIHRTVLNTSGKMRLSLTLRFVSSEVQVKPGYTSHYIGKKVPNP